MLKYAYSLSDEAVVERWLENPYWQYFCGEEVFRHEFPADPSSLTRWRKRLEEAGAEELLAAQVQAAKELGLLRTASTERLAVDTTVQEKAVRYPTDAQLLNRCREQLVGLAEAEGIPLRQSYTRVGRAHLIKVQRYGHAKQYRRMRREIRRLHTLLGRVKRDIERKGEAAIARNTLLAHKLEQAERLLAQTKERKAKGKLYSLHAPEVECLSKGKAHKRYEFGVKVSIAATLREAFVVGARSFPGNPYDGHTLAEAVEQAATIAERPVREVFVDRGYRGVELEDTGIFRPGQRRPKLSRRQRARLRRRSLIEAVIGHMKTDNRLGRNYLLGADGDAINAVLAAVGYNLRRLLGYLRVLLTRILAAILRPLAASIALRPQPVAA